VIASADSGVPVDRYKKYVGVTYPPFIYKKYRMQPSKCYVYYGYIFISVLAKYIYVIYLLF